MNICKKHNAVWCALFLSMTSATMYPMAATLVRGASFLITQHKHIEASLKFAPIFAMALTIAWSKYQINQELAKLNSKVDKVDERLVEVQGKVEEIGANVKQLQTTTDGVNQRVNNLQVLSEEMKQEVGKTNEKLDNIGNNVSFLQEQGNNVLTKQNELMNQVDKVIVSQRELFTLSANTSDKVTNVNKITQKHTTLLMNIQQRADTLEETTTGVKENMATRQQVDSINQTIKDQLESFQKAITAMLGKVGINVNGSGLTLKRSNSVISLSGK